MSTYNEHSAAWSLARDVERILRVRSRRAPPPPLPHAAWHACARAAERLRLACERNWRAALPVAARQFYANLDTLRRQLAAIPTWEPVSRVVPSSGEIAHDVAALGREFSEVFLDGPELVVVTERIVLDGMSFGEFELRLDLEASAAAHFPLRVVALEPNHADSNDSVTHPHVSDERLCAGDGALPLQKALGDGRLFDVFEIAARILATYNAESAYVSVDAWDGRRCPDCDDLVDDLVACRACGDECCDECSATCQRCDDAFCSTCVRNCTGCEDGVCPGCSAGCSVCHRTFCKDCLDGELCCAQCRPDEDSPDEEETIAQDQGASPSTIVPAAPAFAAAADAPLHP